MFLPYLPCFTFNWSNLALEHVRPGTGWSTAVPNYNPLDIIAAGWHLMGSSKDFLGSDLFFTQLLPLLSSSFALRSLRKANMRQFIKKSLGPNASNAREELFIQQLLFCCSMCFLLCSSREGPKVMLANALRLDVSSSIRTCWNMLEH